MKCRKCGEQDMVAENSGICLNCGFRNKPKVDPEEERRKAAEAARRKEEEARRKQLRTLRSRLDKARTKLESGDVEAAAAFMTDHEKEVRGFGDPELTTRFLELEARYYRVTGVEEFYVKTLKELTGMLEFTRDHYEHFYELAVKYQENGRPAAAHALFKRFVDAHQVTYRDVRERYEATAGFAGMDEPEAESRLKIRAGGFELGSETFARWLAEADREHRHFRDPLLISGPEEFEEVIERVPPGVEISEEKITERVRQQVGPMMAVDVDVVSILSEEAGAREMRCILLRPGPGMKRFSAPPAGGVEVAAEIIMPQVGADRVKVRLHVYFRPAGPDQYQDISDRDFNEAVQDALRRFHPLDHNPGLKAEIDGVKRTICRAIQQEINAQSGPARF
jgi:ribosomal protein L37E